MILYQTVDGQWCGTQAEARSVAGKDWVQVNVPTDKPALIDWLNKRDWITRDTLDRLEPSNEPDDTMPLVREAAKRVSIYEIEDYILNRATVAGVEDIFAALGTRFKTLADDRRGA
jgi:hypothetical protein